MYSGMVGFPDLMVLRDGLWLFLETKKRGGKLSENQRSCIQTMLLNGANVWTAFPGADNRTGIFRTHAALIGYAEHTLDLCNPVSWATLMTRGLVGTKTVSGLD